MAYPNVEYWSALKDGGMAPVGEMLAPTFLVDAGNISIPSGKLYCLDPVTYDCHWEDLSIPVPVGRHRVLITYVDLSDEVDSEHYREAYATIVFDGGSDEVVRRIITPMSDGTAARPESLDGNMDSFPVDFATACFADLEVMRHLVAIQDDAMAQAEYVDPADPWFEAMENPNDIFQGVANVPIPSLGKDASIVLFHTGWGDGGFPIVGGYDRDERLISVHVDFLVVEPRTSEDDND